jgi:hypothetical protein
VLTEKSVESNAPIELFIDEIAVSTGMDVETFMALKRWKKINIAARWHTRRRLELVTQDMMHARMKAERPGAK